MNSVIIGAGQCGRGYLARLLTLSKEAFTFIDQDEILIHQLQEQKQYEISFCGSDRKTMSISGYQAFSWDDPNSIMTLARADVIFTSITEQHLPELIEPLKKALEQRKKENKPILITAENGTAPKQRLSALEGLVELSESVIFCTTLKQKDTLDILSEDLDYLPYDRTCLTQALSIYGMKEEVQFRSLLERKIYTYNSLSACVAYLGAYQKYDSYGEAANDAIIRNFLDITKKELDIAIASCYKMDINEQQAFSNMAIAKFKNRDIIDTVERNARDVKRKLGGQERILAPIRLIVEYSQNPACFIVVCAAALWYGDFTKSYCILENQDKQEWELSCKSYISKEIMQRIELMFLKFNQGVSLKEIMQEAGL